VRAAITIDPLVSGQQLITPEGLGASGKATCPKSEVDSEREGVLLAVMPARFADACRAVHPPCLSIDADTFPQPIPPD
jgi:hypothetical protein